MLEIILDQELWSQFEISNLRINSGISLKNNCLLAGNQFIILGKDEDSDALIVELDEWELGLAKSMGRNIKSDFSGAVKIADKPIARAMFNMINNAIQQWLKLTPFIGKEVCENLSVQASLLLSSYGLSLLLT